MSNNTKSLVKSTSLTSLSSKTSLSSNKSLLAKNKKGNAKPVIEVTAKEVIDPIVETTQQALESAIAQVQDLTIVETTQDQALSVLSNNLGNLGFLRERQPRIFKVSISENSTVVKETKKAKENKPAKPEDQRMGFYLNFAGANHLTQFQGEKNRTPKADVLTTCYLVGNIRIAYDKGSLKDRDLIIGYVNSGLSLNAAKIKAGHLKPLNSNGTVKKIIHANPLGDSFNAFLPDQDQYDVIAVDLWMLDNGDQLELPKQAIRAIKAERNPLKTGITAWRFFCYVDKQ